MHDLRSMLRAPLLRAIVNQQIVTLAGQFKGDGSTDAATGARYYGYAIAQITSCFR